MGRAQKKIIYKNMKKVINKWQIHWSFGRLMATLERGWKEISFGIFKIHTMPKEGEMLNKKMYKGFLTKFHIWFPID